jgi:hypothetical protein
MPAAWTSNQRAHRTESQADFCVVAKMHKGRARAVIAWADATHRFVRIDRKTEWGNLSGDRATIGIDWSIS